MAFQNFWGGIHFGRNNIDHGMYVHTLPIPIVSIYYVLHVMSKPFGVMMVIKNLSVQTVIIYLACLGNYICNHENIFGHLSLSSFVGMAGVPPHQRHPQVHLFAQTTGMPKYYLFFQTSSSDHNFFQEMTIKHFMYVWKVPFLYIYIYLQKGPV